MIVILHEKSVDINIYPTDTLTITYDGRDGESEVLSVLSFNKQTSIKRLVLFVFADSDGSCYNSNISFSLVSEKMPTELETAFRLNELSIDQITNLQNSTNYLIIKNF